jgi:hypothetical protein
MNTIQAIFNDPDIAFLRPQFMKLDDGKRNTELLSPSTTVIVPFSFFCTNLLASNNFLFLYQGTSEQ